LDMLQTLAHWMVNGEQLLKERARNARKLGRPNSAAIVADLVWRSAQRGPVNKRYRTRLGRTRLIDLLTNNNVPWREMQSAAVDSIDE